MKAAVYYENGGPEVLRYEDVPDPKCAPSGVVIDVRAVGIEGGDVLNRAGGRARRRARTSSGTTARASSPRSARR